jgi:hypothetical protein
MVVNESFSCYLKYYIIEINHALIAFELLKALILVVAMIFKNIVHIINS